MFKMEVSGVLGTTEVVLMIGSSYTSHQTETSLVVKSKERESGF